MPQKLLFLFEKWTCLTFYNNSWNLGHTKTDYTIMHLLDLYYWHIQIIWIPMTQKIKHNNTRGEVLRKETEELKLVLKHLKVWWEKIEKAEVKVKSIKSGNQENELLREKTKDLDGRSRRDNLITGGCFERNRKCNLRKNWLNFAANDFWCTRSWRDKYWEST